jgi:hypothetical protein
MRNEEWIALFRRIPPEQHSTLVLVCQTGNELALETVFRTEPTYLVMRGRIAGTPDEGRLFFIPYSQLTYLRIERVVSETEVPGILGEPPPESVELAEDPVAAANGFLPPPEANGTVPVPPAIITADDPSAVAKNNLLAKIRAARAAVSTATPPK